MTAPPLSLDPGPDGLLGSEQMAALAGITKRQITAWPIWGIITPTIPPAGQGSRTRWHPDQVPQLRIVAAIMALAGGGGSQGSLTPCDLATAALENLEPWHLHTPGLFVTLTAEIIIPTAGELDPDGPAYWIPRTTWEPDPTRP